MAPVYAVPRLLARNGLTLQDFDYYEIHEAFAAQVLCTLKAWEDADYINSCFFTTHEWAQHFVDQTVFDQGFNAFRSLHQLLLWVLYYQIRVWHSLYGNRLAGGRGYRPLIT